MPGVDFPNTVVTEIDCGPPTDSKGILSKAFDLAGRMSKASFHTASGHMRSHSSGDEIELHHRSDGGITVSYDVWRTVEEVRRDSSVQENSIEGIFPG
jgi:hypothetical protein